MRKLMQHQLAIAGGLLLLGALTSAAVSEAQSPLPSPTAAATLRPPPVPAATPDRPPPSLGPVPASAPAALIRPPSTPGPMPPMMTSEDQRSFGITSATDVTANPDDVQPTPSVGAAEAVRIAAAHIGFVAVNARILHGSAKPTASEPERTVWIVLFGGGELPVLGPPGRPSHAPVERTFTGVVVDDASGAVLTWFMR